MGTGIEDSEILRMTHKHIIALQSKERPHIVGRQFTVTCVIGYHLVGLRIHHLKTATQGSYHQSVLSIFCHAPDTIVSQITCAHLIGFH